MSPVFAGREDELAVLEGAFDAAAAAPPATVLVGAEAGGGKSRLVAEFAARVRDRALVLAGGCVELTAGGLPFAPFAAALRELVRERGVPRRWPGCFRARPAASWPHCCRSSALRH